jgi:hypothetical protein
MMPRRARNKRHHILLDELLVECVERWAGPARIAQQEAQRDRAPLIRRQLRRSSDRLVEHDLLHPLRRRRVCAIGYRYNQGYQDSGNHAGDFEGVTVAASKTSNTFEFASGSGVDQRASTVGRLAGSVGRHHRRVLSSGQ